MKIEVLGTGCAKCNLLAEHAQQALAGAGVQAEITKVTDINEITSRGVMMTPALVIDGEVKVMGRVPSVKDIESMLAKCTP